MRVLVQHGHFAFFPSTHTDVIHFQRYFKLQLIKKDDFYTFPALKDLPRYSLMLGIYGNLPALVTYEGRFTWEVMRENSFVYSLGTELLIPRTAAMVQTAKISQSQDYAISDKPLIQPGCVLEDGRVLTGYEGELDMKWKKLYLYSLEVL